MVKIAKKILNDIELENWLRFHKRGCSARCRCKINQINLDESNGLIHSLKVLDICRELLANGSKFLTEATPNSDEKRRIDIVNLSNLTIIEVEVSGAVKPDADITYKLEKDSWNIIKK